MVESGRPNRPLPVTIRLEDLDTLYPNSDNASAAGLEDFTERVLWGAESGLIPELRLDNHGQPLYVLVDPIRGGRWIRVYAGRTADGRILEKAFAAKVSDGVLRVIDLRAVVVSRDPDWQAYIDIRTAKRESFYRPAA